MEVIFARNVGRAFVTAMGHLRRGYALKPRASRNGPVLMYPTPVTTVFERPVERVLFNPLRDANPFFHLFESIWMIAGRNDVAYPARFAQQLALYSDDQVRLNGAYGYRWRHWFGYDQLDAIVRELRQDHDTRRCVLGMWDPGKDLHGAASGLKDVPCNTQVMFSVADGALDMTVTNRSNDVIWGAYGANAVHFSVLQEYVATALRCTVGRYYQVSNNFHFYTERPDVQRLISAPDLLVRAHERVYEEGLVVTMPMFTGSMAKNQEDAERFVDLRLDGPLPEFNSPFYVKVAAPMLRAHAQHKAGDSKGAVTTLVNAQASAGNVDWLVAGTQWLVRRAYKNGESHAYV